MTKLFIFPGQGSQTTNSLQEYYKEEVQDLILKLDDIYRETRLKISQTEKTTLFKEEEKNSLDYLINEADKEIINLTEFSQPLIFINSIFKDSLIKNSTLPNYVDGHSIGKYAALVSAEVLTPKKALELVIYRSLFMSNSMQPQTGSMAAILKIDDEKIIKLKKLEKIIRKIPEIKGKCEIANINTPYQVVISGDLDAIKYVCNEVAKSMILTNILYAFHSFKMEDADKKMNKVLKENKQYFKDATIPIILNKKIGLTKDKDEIFEDMIGQIKSPVYWNRSMKFILSEIDEVYSIGPGQVTLKMVKKIKKEYYPEKDTMFIYV